MTEGPPKSWEKVKQNAEIVKGFPERYRVPALIMKVVPQLIKGAKVNAPRLRHDIANPQMEVNDVVRGAKGVLEGEQVDANAMLVAASLALLSFKDSFIINNAK